MGGEGSMTYAIVSLKQNRALLRKPRFRDLRKLYLEKSGRTPAEFKMVGKKELALIKEQIRREAKSNREKQIVIIIASLILTIGIVIFLMNWLFF